MTHRTGLGLGAGSARVSAAIELLRAAVEDVADAVVLIDATQRIVAFNRAACEMFGYDTGKIIGAPLDVLLPTAMSGHHQRHVRGFAAGSATKRLMGERRTLLGRRRDGEEFPVEVTIAKTRFAGHDFINAVVRDVSTQRREEATLQSNLARLSTLMRFASDGIVVCDADGVIVYASPFAEEISGVLAGGSVGLRAGEFLHPDDRDRLVSLVAQIRSVGGSSADCQARLGGANERWVRAELTVTNLIDDPAVNGFVVNFRDVTARRTADAQRETVSALGLIALAGCPLSELAMDAVNRLVGVLDADVALVLERAADDEQVIRACVGLPDGLIGTWLPITEGSPAWHVLNDRAPVVIDDYPALPPFVGKALLEEVGISSALDVTIPGKQQPWGVLCVLSRQPARFTPEDAGFAQAVANVLASAIEREAADEALSRQALHDPLTGLPNRALLVDRIDSGLAGVQRWPNTRLVVQFIDVDNFKRINDSLGHRVGDELLCHVAQRLQAVVRAEDTVARFGGDEFVVVSRLREDLDSPIDLADRVLAAIHQPYNIDGRDLYITASMGIALSSPHTATVDALLRDADAAMYQAKRHGRDRYEVFDAEFRQQLLQRLDTERDLRAALAHDEFRLHYQPIVDSTTGRTVGLEALLRWQHPQRGLTLPGEFISVAEDTGQIIPIGEWVLRSACSQLAEWQREFPGPDLSVSVNLSPRQLADPDLLDRIQDALHVSGVAASSLRLEITETMLVDNLTRASGTLKAIAQLGVRIVIDDFGTGYSSLTYLKNFPIDCIKIDGSFITNICNDPADRAIVAAVAELARQLGVAAVVECVETAEQLAAVVALGCTLIQGHYYSAALPPAEVRARFAPRHATMVGSPTG